MIETTWKPTLCIDFDGVIHSYDKGWQDGSIYGTLVPGFVVWAIEASNTFKLVVYSSRSTSNANIVRMEMWLEKQLAERLMPREIEQFMELLSFSNEKPAAFLTIDDRAICFNGDWDAPELSPTILRQFKTWNTKT
jgi:hypothetical protein